MTHALSNALATLRGATAGGSAWAAFRSQILRLTHPGGSWPALDNQPIKDQLDAGLTHRQVQSIASLPLSADAMTILAIRDCGASRPRRSDY